MLQQETAIDKIIDDFGNNANLIPKTVYNTSRFKVVQKKWPKNEKQNGPFGTI